MLQSTMLLALAGLSSFSYAAPTPVVKRGGSGKRGLAFGKDTGDRTNLFNGGKVTWGYNWEAQKKTFDTSLEFVPMLHDDSPMFSSVFVADAELAIAGGSRHVLSINEPDQCGGGGTCMTGPDGLTRAVNAHKTYVQQGIADKHANVRIGSIAVTNGAGEMGITYLKKFLDQCDGCRIDFVAAHWYNGGDIDAFKAHIKNVHTETNMPVWVTEWAAPGNDEIFMKAAMEWMDEQAYVERYAYQSVDTALTAGNTLSALGTAYASA